MSALVLVVFLTLFISAHCSLFEATLYSTRMGTLEAAASKEEKRSLARRFMEMKKNIAVPIASILILNTISNTLGATVAGIYAARTLGPSLIPLFSVGFTLAILFVAEILPKTLGAVYWRRLWPFIVWPLRSMEYLLYPAVRVTQKFSNLLMRGHVVQPVTEDEILAMVRLGAREGEITQRESLMVHNIIALENKSVRDIMTPRTVIFMLDASMTVEEALKAADKKGFTRIPIYEGDRENVVGYIMIHDLGSAKTLSRPRDTVKSIAKPISFVPETVNCLSLLTNFLKHRRHIAMVVDEYGGIAGLVTLEDLIETALGTEIVDERDKVVDLQEIARRRRNKDTGKGKST